MEKWTTSSYEYLLDRGAERGWSVDTMLLIACDYIDQQDNPHAFDDYLVQVEAEEEEMGLRREPEKQDIIDVWDNIDWTRYDISESDGWEQDAPSHEVWSTDCSIIANTQHCGKPMFYMPWTKRVDAWHQHYRAFAICLRCGKVEEI